MNILFFYLLYEKENSADWAKATIITLSRLFLKSDCYKKKSLVMWFNPTVAAHKVFWTQLFSNFSNLLFLNKNLNSENLSAKNRLRLFEKSKKQVTISESQICRFQIFLWTNVIAFDFKFLKIEDFLRAAKKRIFVPAWNTNSMLATPKKQVLF